MNIFDPELQPINSKPMIKLKELLSNLKQTILALDCQQRNDCKIFYSSVKLIASDSDIDKACKSKQESIITKIKNIYF